MATREAIDWDDLFMTAALEPTRWVESLGVMASHTGSRSGQMIGIGGAREIPFNLVSNFEPAHLREFVDIGGGSPDLNFRIAANEQYCARGRYDTVLHERHYDAVIDTLRSDHYVRWCEDRDIPFGCQTNLVVDRVGLVGFAMLRSRQDGRSTPAQRRTFAHAAQAARRAVRLQERIEGEQAKLLAGAFDSIGVAAFIIDARGRLLSHTAGAEQHLERGEIRLSGAMLEASAQPLSVAQAVAALTAAPGMAHVRLRLDPVGDHPPVFLEGFRLPERPLSLGRLPHAILIARGPSRDRAGIAALLRILYGLTTAEAEVAMRLYDGRTRAQIADERAVTAETLKSQIKRIYLKIDVAGETDLIRRLTPLMQ